MADAARRRAGYQDVLDAPPHLVAEVVAGELRTHPRPAPRHAQAASVLGMDIGSPFHRGSGGGPGGWWILYEPELHLGPDPDILVPDVAGWRKERMAELPSEAYFTLPPDWIAEVLSPSTARFDRVDKRPVYAREAVRHLWLVDPDARTLEAFALDGSSYRLSATHGGSARVRVEPFEAIELDLGGLWADGHG